MGHGVFDERKHPRGLHGQFAHIKRSVLSKALTTVRGASGEHVDILQGSKPGVWHSIHFREGQDPLPLGSDSKPQDAVSRALDALHPKQVQVPA